MDKRFLGILAVIIVVFAGIFFISQNSSNNSSGSSKSSGAQPTSNIQGENAKNVALIEYGDYECPVCGSYYAPLKQAVTPMLPNIHFQFRNLPLTAIHQNAFAGARAAEAAGLQGKYWEMHDLLYENQTSWATASSPQDNFNAYAKQLKLNVDQFKKDYISSKVNDSINADLAEFGKTGQDKATPTFFINGVYLPNSSLVDAQTGAPSAEKITAAIQAEIAKKSQ